MTGTNDMRPDFQRMLKDSTKRQWEVVLVYKLPGYKVVCFFILLCSDRN